MESMDTNYYEGILHNIMIGSTFILLISLFLDIPYVGFRLVYVG